MKTPDDITNIPSEMFEKYNVPCPYYTSYPPLGRWDPKFSASDFREALGGICARELNVPVSLYVHFPFCDKLCYFCLCNSLITRDRGKIRVYVENLLREIDLLKRFFDEHGAKPLIRRIHIGGGSPNLMDDEELALVIERLSSLAGIPELDEFTFEVDVRTADKPTLARYAGLGINRVSLGIQDFDPRVQKAVNRIQPLALVQEVFSDAVKKMFKGINYDLLYGLPLQTRQSFMETLKVVNELAPDRITLLKYAHMPERAKRQRMIREADLPPFQENARIFTDAVSFLVDNGYIHVGIDHFAKETDSLARGLKEKLIWRNFNGFSEGKTHNLIGVGLTSTSGISDYYAQNTYGLGEYYKLVAAGAFPVCRGYRLDRDELIRRDAINSILCLTNLSFEEIEKKHDIRFEEYFKEELGRLDEFIKDGIIEFNNRRIAITPSGRIFVQHVCKIFDRELKGNRHYKISGP